MYFSDSFDCLHYGTPFSALVKSVQTVPLRLVSCDSWIDPGPLVVTTTLQGDKDQFERLLSVVEALKNERAPCIEVIGESQIDGV